MADVESGDPAKTAMTAHALKNEALNIGAEALRGLAEGMVLAGRAGRGDELGQLLPKVLESMDALKGLLDQALGPE